MNSKGKKRALEEVDAVETRPKAAVPTPSVGIESQTKLEANSSGSLTPAPEEPEPERKVKKGMSYTSSLHHVVC